MHLFAGDLVQAASLVEQVQAAAEATGSSLSPYGALGLSAFRGREADAVPMVEATNTDLLERGEGIGITVIGWSNAVLHNGLARFDVALTAALEATEHTPDLGTANWGLVELIEAAARRDTPELAVPAHRRLREMARVSGTDWALGIEARCSALLATGAPAEHLYRQAIERLGRTRLRAELARAHLLYGEWLRRENRRVHARDQLRAAHDQLMSIGMEGFAERARIELAATGETARKRRVETRDELTAQELQVARMALDGLSNPEIGARLFISPRTVKYHLHKVFAKLDISSRGELGRVLPGEPVGASRV
jgi:ATP/maltotriose-dependent transcriptional regulator MalT